MEDDPTDPPEFSSETRICDLNDTLLALIRRCSALANGLTALNLITSCAEQPMFSPVKWIDTFNGDLSALTELHRCKLMNTPFNVDLSALLSELHRCKIDEHPLTSAYRRLPSELHRCKLMNTS